MSWFKKDPRATAIASIFWALIVVLLALGALIGWLQGR